MILKSAPTSSSQETGTVEAWVRNSFPQARLDQFGSHQGQIEFEVLALTAVKGHYGGIEHTEDEVPEEHIIATTSFARIPRAVQREGGEVSLPNCFKCWRRVRMILGCSIIALGRRL